MKKIVALHVGMIIGDMGLTGERSPKAAFTDWKDHSRQAKEVDVETLDEIQQEMDGILATLGLMDPMIPSFKPFAVLFIVRTVLVERKGNGAPAPDAAAVDRLVNTVASLLCVQLEVAEHQFVCRAVRNELGIPWYVNAYATGEATHQVSVAYARPLASVRVATVPEELQAIGRMLVDDHDLRQNEQIHVASEPMPCLTWKEDADDRSS